MRFLRGAKFALHAEMNLERAALEPTASSLRQIRRLACFRDLQNARVECARLVLATMRHRQLNVIEGYDRHLSHLDEPRRQHDPISPACSAIGRAKLLRRGDIDAEVGVEGGPEALAQLVRL